MLRVLAEAAAPSFFQFRLVEILNLVVACGFGAYIAYSFTRTLSFTTRKKELLVSSISSLIGAYEDLFIFLDKFMDGDSGGQKANVVLMKFKDTSARLWRIGIAWNRLKLSPGVISKVRYAHNELNNIVTGDSWGDKKKKYDEIHKTNAKKQMQMIRLFLEEAQYSVYS